MVAQLKTSALGSNPSADLSSGLGSELLLPTVEGLVQVVTAPQRSFFAGVMAQALRVAGEGRRVLVVQFLKGGIQQGPEHPVQLGQNLDWLRCDLSRCISTPQLSEPEQQALTRLWQHTQRSILSGDYSLAVLDELSLAVNLGLIPEVEVLDLLQQRPVSVDIILTGPDMPLALLEAADQITELRRSRCP